MQAIDQRFRHDLLVRHVARALAALVGITAISVFAGWMFDVAFLRSFMHPGRTAMNPLTALEFLLASTALYLHTTGRRVHSRIGTVLGALVGVDSLLRVVAYATSLDYSLDRMLFADRLGSNSMAPNTAVGFVCIGIALTAIDVRSSFWGWVGRIALLAASWIALLSLTGYVYNIRPLYGVTGYVPMALNTAFAFAILCSAIVAARPHREPLATILGIGAGGETARRLLPAATLVPLVLGFLWLEAERAHLFDLEYGLSIYALANVLTLSMLIWLGSRSIARVDAERRRATEQLREATLAAEEANRAKSFFLANMSHEIRTPMNGVLGMLELMRNAEFTGQQREYLGIAQQSAEALLRLLNDILDFSKIEAGKLELEAIVFPLRDLLADTLQAQTVRAAAKELELAYDVAPDVHDGLIGDPGRLRQVLYNLAGNAIKFTERGEVVVTVRTLDRIDNDTLLEFSVRDTGIGIEPATIEHLFLPFSQADTSTTRRYGGTGLGLAISRQLVALMGGRITVDSTPGVGSTFCFTARFGIGPSSPRAHLSAAAFRSLNVLIVDDNETNRLILSEMLSNWGMLPQAVDSGASALEFIEQHADAPPRLILLDAMMPEMDGFTLAHHIRQIPSLDATMLMLSSSGQTVDIDAHGLARCLTKPVKQSDLFDAIAEALDGVVHVPTEMESPPAHEAELVAPRNVLLVDDGLVNQAVAANLLRRRGHHVTIANNGKEAIDLVARVTFDIVLMDVQMPVMDGFEATGIIREREAGTAEHLPVVAMTAHAMRGDRERCLAAGMDGYLTKPVNVAELQAAVEGVPLRHAKADANVNVMRDDHTLNRTALSHAESTLLIDVLARFGGDQELLRDVAGLFGQSVAGWCAELREAAERSDNDALARVAHAIKGSVGNFTSTGAFEAAKQLEVMAKHGESSGIAVKARELEQDLHRLARTLHSAGGSAS